jgi:hypothetical protein
LLLRRVVLIHLLNVYVSSLFDRIFTADDPDKKEDDRGDKQYVDEPS